MAAGEALGKPAARYIYAAAAVVVREVVNKHFTISSAMKTIWCTFSTPLQRDFLTRKESF